jgi:hypothetical protein
MIVEPVPDQLGEDGPFNSILNHSPLVTLSDSDASPKRVWPDAKFVATSVAERALL